MFNWSIYKRLLLLSSLTMPFSVQALECHLDSANGITEETEDIGQLKIPATLPIGERLWTSQPMSRNVVCWGYPNVPQGEWVYFYPNPDKKMFAPGISMGVIYNGTDLGLITTATQTDMFRKPNQKELGHVNYQVYLQKTGDITQGGPARFRSFNWTGSRASTISRGKITGLP